jgi:hypothetical protein
MNILFKRAALDGSSKELGIRDLHLLVFHKSRFDKDLKSFVHHIMAIGYGGGGVQEEAFYRIEGSKFDGCPIYYSSVCGPGFLDYDISNGKLISVDLELPADSKKFQFEAIDSLKTYVHLDEYNDIWAPLADTKEFYVSDKFPMHLITHLQQVHWPFSTHF